MQRTASQSAIRRRSLLCVQMKDQWFFQQEIERQFTEFPNLSADLVPVFEQRDSYVESLYSFCLPIPFARLKQCFHEISWHFDYTSSRARLFRRGSKHFLSRAFRNRSPGIELRWYGSFQHFYVDPNTNITVAQQRQHEAPGHRFKCIMISPILLARFLADTRQALLWCVSSHRRTERHLDEFGVDSYKETIQHDYCIYVRAANAITTEGKYQSPRIESCSWIVGKRRVHEIECSG